MNLQPILLLILSMLLYNVSLTAQDNNLKGYTLEALDSLYQQAERPQDKLPYAQAMLTKGQQELNTQDTAYAKLLYRVGEIYKSLNNFSEAIVYLQKAIDIQEEKVPLSKTYANSLSSLGAVYYYQGKLKKVEEAWNKTLTVLKKAYGEEHPTYSKILNNLAILYKSKGDYAKSEQLNLQSLSIKQKTIGRNNVGYAQGLNNLGTLYREMGEYSRAEQFGLQALGIVKEILGDKHIGYIKVSGNLGVLYYEQKEYEKAEERFLQAAKSTKEVYGIEHPDYIASLSNLGLLYKEMERYKKAEKYMRQALNIRKKSLGKKHYLNAQTLNNLGALYATTGDYQQAESCYLEALEIKKEKLGDKHPEYLSTLNNLGGIYREYDLNQAWACILKAINKNADMNIDRYASIHELDSLAKRSFVSYKQMNKSLYHVYKLLAVENTQQAKAQQTLICDLALTLQERNKNELGDESDKLRILKERSDWVLRALHVLDIEDNRGKALEIIEQNKSVLLLDAFSSKRSYIAGLIPDYLIKEEQQLQKKYTNTKAALAKKRPPAQRDSIRDVLTSLSMEMEAFQKRMQKTQPKYAALRYQGKAIKADEIQATLDDQTALLEYFLGDSVVYVFYIDKQKIKAHKVFVGNEAIKNRIQSLHEALSNYKLLMSKKKGAYQKYTNQAYWFYEKLVAPALKNAKGIEKLVVITDGELGHLPFEAFLVEEAPQKEASYENLHYLIEDYDVSYNYSATLWKENKENTNRSNNGQILGIAANYDLLLDSTKINWRLPTDRRLRKHLNALPAARKEVQTLQENFRGYFAFDTLASEQLFKEKAADYGVIHLAMHGLLNKREQMLSSLAFTEISDSTQNNFLQAYEISKMELNADLVVLSACETGFGKFEIGNGIASLARSFMYAGVPALVVSLWQVNDDATSRIMQSFYQNLAEGMPKDKALRQAKLDYMQSVKGIAAHPAFWSPFILIGNTEAVTIAQKSSILPWAIGGGLLLFVLAGFLFSRRKKEATS